MSLNRYFTYYCPRGDEVKIGTKTMLLIDSTNVGWALQQSAVSISARHKTSAVARYGMI